MNQLINFTCCQSLICIETVDFWLDEPLGLESLQHQPPEEPIGGSVSGGQVLRRAGGSAAPIGLWHGGFGAEGKHNSFKTEVSVKIFEFTLLILQRFSCCFKRHRPVLLHRPSSSLALLPPKPFTSGQNHVVCRLGLFVISNLIFSLRFRLSNQSQWRAELNFLCLLNSGFPPFCPWQKDLERVHPLFCLFPPLCYASAFSYSSDLCIWSNRFEL